MSEPEQLVTVDGVPVTEELVARLVAEAEAGYDVSLLRARGRPRLAVGPSAVVPVRLDAVLRMAHASRRNTLLL